MEIKSVYMDLVEGKKSGNVWKLESEAFKDPIEIKIGYDNKELAEFKGNVEELREQIRLVGKSTIDWMNKWIEARNEREALSEELTKHKTLIAKLTANIDSQNEEINQLYKVIADAKTMIETQSGTIIHLQEEMKLIQKKITKQPMVFSDTTFISGHERVGLGILEVPSGEYLVIEKYLLLEPNEFVENHDGIKINKITVADNQYIPMYNLFGGTPLDTPTAKVYWTLAFIPC